MIKISLALFKVNRNAFQIAASLLRDGGSTDQTDIHWTIFKVEDEISGRNKYLVCLICYAIYSSVMYRKVAFKIKLIDTPTTKTPDYEVRHERWCGPPLTAEKRNMSIRGTLH